MLNGKWKPLRITGFGIAVVSAQGSLIGHGLGWPPSWVTTAAAAEAWALSIVLQFVPFPPKMRTDCLALLQTAKEGTQKATHHSKPLARIWRSIADTVGRDVCELLHNDLLVWFPAHQSLKAVGEVKGSNGKRLTAVDWRANRLVDKLAKEAAGALQHSKHVIELFKSAEAATAHAACLLGVVTHAANNHVRTETDEFGQTSTKILRDSVDKPKTKRASSAPPVQTKAVPSAPKELVVPRTVLPWRPPSAATLSRRELAATLERRVEAIGASLRATSGAPATERMAQLAERIRARELHFSS